MSKNPEYDCEYVWITTALGDVLYISEEEATREQLRTFATADEAYAIAEQVREARHDMSQLAAARKPFEIEVLKQVRALRDVSPNDLIRQVGLISIADENLYLAEVAVNNAIEHCLALVYLPEKDGAS